jgi:hypothetical protein
MNTLSHSKPLFVSVVSLALMFSACGPEAQFEESAPDDAQTSSSALVISKREIVSTKEAVFNVNGANAYKIRCLVKGDPTKRILFEFQVGNGNSAVIRTPANARIVPPTPQTVVKVTVRNSQQLGDTLYCEVDASNG